MNTTFTKEQFLAAYNAAPQAIRDVFNDEKTTMLVLGLKEKHQLHIDTAGTLGKEVGYLLIGLTDPTAFVARIRATGLPESVVSDIVSELNQRIFVPLHEKMKGGGGVPAKTRPQDGGTQAPAVKEEAVRSTDEPEKAPEGNGQSLPPRSALPRPTMTPPATVPAAAPPRQSVPPPAQTLPAPKPSINKLGGWRSDMPAVPKSDLMPTEKTPAPREPLDTPPTPPPASAPMPTTEPKTAPPPPNLPGVATPAPSAPSVPLTKSYATDPYREPIDDKS